MEFKEIAKSDMPYNLYYKIVRDHSPKDFKDKYFIVETLEKKEFNNFEESLSTYKKYLLEDANYEIKNFNFIINSIGSKITLIKLKFNILNKDVKEQVLKIINKNKEYLEIVKNIDNIQPIVKKLPEKIKIPKKTINEKFIYLVDTSFSNCPQISKVKFKYDFSKLKDDLSEFEYCYSYSDNAPVFFSSDETEDGKFKNKNFPNYTIFTDMDKAIHFYETKVSDKINEINKLKNKNLSNLIYSNKE